MAFVEKETLIEFVKQNTPHFDGETTMECVERAIKNAPTADVVEVVRCKDCKWYAPNNNGSWVGCAIRIVAKEDEPTDNDFCSYGERKEK